ncbi:pyridoxine/pyridoxamine 5'-phosphate oxidase [Sphingobacterium faecium NBRC 15299]|jgi:pyridoxamine 5'-phosphate oxidase|uniref:pyridoxamine 5'-phosphate oxidase n=1 Tax=Sphingobacterium faecium TaxID=34087 RepID=UPI000D3B7544|nr:pyridoxamine 5'-phosphate oxidase [Sphingobacterium faecium]PTX10061.1 pyridoxamine 5'-phosphate oxidase [Sphingobacterium faecium]GEM65430.1 pyridoxine/pyridoxamine 5'-phosphate oxidase [Sphingobacterium faecium NBRC 15299]
MAIEHKDIAAIRQDYALGNLCESDVSNNPLVQFEKWFNEAIHSEVLEANAMVLSTVGEFSLPSSRIVLLKDLKNNGFSFFTNFNSRKGLEIDSNPHVAALFFWPELQRQVRIEGLIEKLPAEDSDEYFQSRPKGSRIGALASPQSETIPNRSFLEGRVADLEKQFENQEVVPRPEFWGGYLIKPLYIEFWQGRSSRLHDRIAFQKVSDSWKIIRLAP